MALTQDSSRFKYLNHIERYYPFKVDSYLRVIKKDRQFLVYLRGEHISPCVSKLINENNEMEKELNELKEEIVKLKEYTKLLEESIKYHPEAEAVKELANEFYSHIK